MHRLRFLLLVVLFPLALTVCANAQTGAASISGRVADPSGAIIQKAAVTMKNVDTGTTMQSQTNDDGIYNFPALKPGNYLMHVEKQGFRSVDATGLTLYTQDQLSRNFALEVGSASESVTVNGAATNDSPAVSMTVDREFVENMPLNGRSFDDLLQLAPGAVSAQNGTYSINGQRTDSNIFTVDGVSANVGGIIAQTAACCTGSLAGDQAMQTALGTTQSLASIDSLQEFKIQTSGYTAEYGRSPGGQVQFTTRSGSNNTHGLLFEYFRNTAMDANSYYNDYHGDPRTAEHQNDFGGTVGGPLIVPKLYNGKDKTFYFFSYEGLRLILPASESEYVPTQVFRNWASPYVQPFLNVAPLPNPNSPGNVDGCTITNPATGQPTACDALFYYGYSYPSSLDNISLRVDQNLGSRLHAFLRYADTPSFSALGAETVERIAANAHTWTAGLTANLTTSLLDDVRFNYSRAGEEEVESERPIGGSVPLQRSLLIPAEYENPFDEAENGIQISGTSLKVTAQFLGENSVQGQYQIVDSLAWTRGKHTLKFGADWRRLGTGFVSRPYQDVTELTSLAAIQQGYATEVEILASGSSGPVLHNLSVFAQDHWNLSSRLSIDYGLRWEFNPPPGPVNGEYPTVLASSNLATATLAPLGTQPYKTQYDKFAPRFGFGWNAIPTQRYALTVRGGIGIFYDTGQQVIVGAYEDAYPFTATKVQQGNISLPLSPATLAPPSLPASNVALTPPYPLLQNLTSQDLTLPYTEQWNLSLDESLNPKNTLTVSYVGNNGRKLLYNQQFAGAPYGNKDFPSGMYFTNNASQSSYNALQVQDVGRIRNGLDVVGSFTYAHALDNASIDSDSTIPIWGNSNYDLRRVLNLALNYQPPAANWSHLVEAVTHGWLLANRFSTQSGYPINLYQAGIVLPDGTTEYYYPDLVVGVPIYLHGRTADVNGKSVPGNWRINRAAFACTTNGATTGACPGTPIRQGTLGRNYVRTSSFWAFDTALQRTFPLYEQLHLNFRADAFNIFNHPNLQAPDYTLSSSTFGYEVGNSASSIGTPNALYAMGAARSLQLSLRLEF